MGCAAATAYAHGAQVRKKAHDTTEVRHRLTAMHVLT